MIWTEIYYRRATCQKKLMIWLMDVNQSPMRKSPVLFKISKTLLASPEKENKNKN